MINRILEDLVAGVKGARAVIFLDNEGEAIAQAGDTTIDIRLLGAWKEIHLEHIREITNRLGLGIVHAVLFSLDEGNELIVPIAGDYCLLLFLSSYANINEALAGLRKAVDLLQQDIA